jgi:NADH-quinone oxidoreductase subunit L
MPPTLPATLLVLVPLLPLLAGLVTIVFGRRLGPRVHLPAVIGIGAAAGAALLLLVAARGTGGGTHEAPRPAETTVTLWQWATIDRAIDPEPGSPAALPGTSVNPTDSSARPLSLAVTLRLDPLTATMLLVITSIGLLVAIYSIGYMHDDPDQPRFFALVSMFVFSMAMLVASSSFLLVYVFWEAVGACSYLLIGFWFRRPEAARAAKKAFLVNRVGDFGLAIAVFLLWLTYGTLDFHDIRAADGTILPGILGQTRLADAAGFVGGTVGTLICLCLLLAACGKSAQVPLHVWLPDAMEGPTPASALIHAATMVTAGVYLVARCAPLFVVSPGALAVVSLVGATTALVAALIGTVQTDLKRVLAYSTISQLGYMFASLGTGTLAGFTAAIFHLVTHACFKALLFLGAGSVMHSMGGVIDMRRFGGLRSVMPITAATFFVGSLALAGVPPFAGFFSKDEILAALHARGWPDAHGGVHHDHEPAAAAPAAVRTARLVPSSDAPVVPAAWRSTAPAATTQAVGPLDWLAGAGLYRGLFWMSLITAGLTAFYTFRAVFMTFTGPLRLPPEAAHAHGGHGHDDDHGPHDHGGHGHGQHGHESHGSAAAPGVHGHTSAAADRAASHESPPVMTRPLVILAGASLVIGWLLFATHGLGGFLAATPSLTAPAVVATRVPPAFHLDLAIQGTLAAAIGIALAAIGHLGRRSDAPSLERFLGPLQTLFARRFFFDEIEHALVVRPLESLAWFAALVDRVVIDGLVDAVARVPVALGDLVRRGQAGVLQRYSLAGVAGVLAVLLALAWQLWQ